MQDGRQNRASCLRHDVQFYKQPARGVAAPLASTNIHVGNPSMTDNFVVTVFRARTEGGDAKIARQAADSLIHARISL